MPLRPTEGTAKSKKERSNAVTLPRQKPLPRSRPPLTTPNPFIPKPLNIRVNPWTAAQRSEIRESFDHQRLKNGEAGINIFISQAAHFLWLYDRNAALESHATIKKKLNRVERAAAELLKALSRLQQGEGAKRLASVGDHLSKWVRLNPENAGAPETSYERQMQRLVAESEDPMLGNQKLMLQRLWTYTTVLRLQAHGSQLGLEASRQHKSHDQRRDMLVSFLYQEWTLVFGAEPSTTRDHEFHRPGGYLIIPHPWPGQNPPPGDGGTRDDYAV